MKRPLVCSLCLAMAGATPAAEPDTVSLERVVADRDGVTVERAADGAVRLVKPTAGAARAVVTASVPLPETGAVGVSASVRANGLWLRDACVVVEFVDGKGKRIGRAQTPNVYGFHGWTDVTGYGDVPAGTASARLALSMAGEPKAEVDQVAFAEFRNVRVWPVPAVRLHGPEIGVVRLGEPLSVSAAISGYGDGARWRAALVDVFGNAAATWDAEAAPRLERTFTKLAPGYCELRWQVVDEGGRMRRRGRSSYMVVDPAPRADESPWAVDAGFAWGIVQRGDEAMGRVARLLWDIGLRRTRDRYSVGGTYPARNDLRPDPYGRAADAQRAAGLRVYQVMHDIPAWMAADPKAPLAHRSTPADLRDLHRFFELAARELHPAVDAWEVWNEPDISFFAGRPEEYAGILKASYLGIKRGNPKVRVLMGSPAHPVGQWLRLVYESGAVRYYDVFNWHTYRAVDTMAADAAAFRELQRQYGCDVPMWLTETGDRAVPVDGDILAGERIQAAQYVKRYVVAAANRVERVFAFYLQEWRKPGSPPFGLIRRDLSPRPALAALAALTRTLGRGEILGTDETVGQTASVVWFESGAGPAAVAWSDKPVPWPDTLKGGKVWSMMGAEAPEPAELGEAPVYVTDLEPPRELAAPPPPATPGHGTAADIERLGVILDLRLGVTDDFPLGDERRKQPVRVIPGESVACELSVYNFAGKAARATVALETPTGWQATGLRPSAQVEPGGKATQRISVTVGAMRSYDAIERIRATAVADGFDIAPAVAAVACDVARLPLTPVSRPGDRLDRWRTTHNKPVSIRIEQTDSDPPWFRVSYRLQAPSGGRWGFAGLDVTEADGVADSNGLRFRFRVRTAWGERLLVIAHEHDGSQYHATAGRLDQVGEHAVRLLWPQFRLNQGVSRDENDRLDIEQIARLSFGTSARSRAQSGAFEIGDIELVKVKSSP